MTDSERNAPATPALITEGLAQRNEHEAALETRSEPRTPRAKTVWLSVGAAVIVLGLVAGTWALASVVQSPAQREANASPPPPQAVFTKVTHGKLADTRVYSGTVAHNDERGFTLPAGTDAVRSVVTGLPPSIGASVSSGQVITEVNTRPVFAVASPFDFFRNLSFGDSGADVKVLQAALAGRGYAVNVDGQYGSETVTAVTRWYRDAGYQAPTKERKQDVNKTTDVKSSGPSAGSGAPPSDGVSPPGKQTDTTKGTAPGKTDSSGSAPPNDPADPGKKPADPPPKPIFDAFVPVSELMAVPSLPATIVTAPGIGANVGGKTPDIILGSATLIVRAEVPPSDTAGLAIGDTVTVISDDNRLDGKVASLSAQPKGDGGAPKPSILTVTFTADPPPTNLGKSIKVEVQNAAVPGDSLIVPTAAVVSRGEGRGVVVKQQSGGVLTEVPIAVRGSLRGMTAIEPDDKNNLAEGDEVRVG